MADEKGQQEPGATGQSEDQQIDLGGEIGKVSLKDLREGYLRQADYTRKTQELARQRQSYEQEAELGRYILENPGLLEKLQAGGEDDADALEAEEPPRKASRKTGGNEPSQESIQAAREFLSNMNSTLAEQMTRQDDFELEMEIRDIRAKYPGIDEKALIDKALKTNSTDLDFVAKALLLEQEAPKMREKIEKEIAEKVRSQPDYFSSRTTSDRAPEKSDFRKGLDEVVAGMNRSIWDKLKGVQGAEGFRSGKT